MFNKLIIILLIFLISISQVNADYFDDIKMQLQTTSKEDLLQKVADIYWEIDILLRENNLEQDSYTKLFLYKKSFKKFLKNFNNISYTFTWFDITKSLIYKDIQDYSLSCESSAASTILTNISWKIISEQEVINNLDWNFYGVPLSWSGVWWNPDLWFVWKITWSQRYKTWYWVYEKPIAKIYQKYGLNTKIINNWNYNLDYTENEHLIEILKELNNWNYVQLWWDYCTLEEEDDWVLSYTNQVLVDDTWLNWKNKCASPYESRIYSWDYYDENMQKNKINWLIWEHSFVLLWYKWEINSPTHIIVWDTNTWRHEFSIKEWFRKWNTLWNKSIIIYK